MIEPLMLIRSAYPCAAPQLGESFGERHRESQEGRSRILFECSRPKSQLVQARAECSDMHHILGTGWRSGFACGGSHLVEQWRSEEHTSELQSLMRISYAVFCLKKKKNHKP